MELHQRKTRQNSRVQISAFWNRFSNIFYPLVNIQKTMENHHAINGKTIHYFDWAMFNSYVSLPEGTLERLVAMNRP